MNHQNCTNPSCPSCNQPLQQTAQTGQNIVQPQVQQPQFMQVQNQNRRNATYSKHPQWLLGNIAENVDRLSFQMSSITKEISDVVVNSYSVNSDTVTGNINVFSESLYTMLQSMNEEIRKSANQIEDLFTSIDLESVGDVTISDIIDRHCQALGDSIQFNREELMKQFVELSDKMDTVATKTVEGNNVPDTGLKEQISSIVKAELQSLESNINKVVVDEISACKNTLSALVKSEIGSLLDLLGHDIGYVNIPTPVPTQSENPNPYTHNTGVTTTLDISSTNQVTELVLPTQYDVNEKPKIIVDEKGVTKELKKNFFGKETYKPV